MSGLGPVALLAAALLVAAALFGCGDPSPAPATPEGAVDRGLRWLWSQQDRDGLLRAETYGVLRRGESVTAAALVATAMLPAARRTAYAAALERAFAALAMPPREQQPLDYPTYAAACHLHALCLLRPEGFEREVARRLSQLRRLQYGSDNGWLPSDPAYGGFGLGDGPPEKPAGSDLVTMSTTVTVLEAVRAAGVAADDPLVVAARSYVERCQHFGSPPDDGGFFAAPIDEWRGGKGGTDDTGSKRAYGTATADGVRALLACGLPREHPRVVAAARWLEQHDSHEVPGLLPEFEPALRFYWAAARGRALVLLGREAPPVRAWLLDRQRGDGAFVGLAPAMKEDEPVVATLLALMALATGA